MELSAASDSKTTFITNHPIAYIGIVALGWMQWTGCCDPKRDYISYTIKTPLRYSEKDYLLLYSLHWKIFSCWERNVFFLLVLYFLKKLFFSEGLLAFGKFWVLKYNVSKLNSEPTEGSWVLPLKSAEAGFCLLFRKHCLQQSDSNRCWHLAEKTLTAQLSLALNCCFFCLCRHQGFVTKTRQVLRNNLCSN